MSARRLSGAALHAADYLGLAETYLGVWAQAVSTQARRILGAIQPEFDEAGGGPTWRFDDGHAALIDTVFFVVALRSLEATSERAVEALRILGASAETAEAALRTFRAEVQDLESLRHAFVHFEDYGFGIGNAQASIAKPMRLQHEVRKDTYVLRVHDAGGVLELDVRAARDAAEALGFEILMAADEYEDDERDD